MFAAAPWVPSTIARMGKRSGTKSVAAVMAAFVTRRTWIQADLARAVGLSTEALRTVLRDLTESHIPLTSEREPPHVYWRISRDWYPGGILFKPELVADLLAELTHLRSSKRRDRLLATVMDQLPARGRLEPIAPIVSRSVSEQEEEYVPVVEAAAARKLPLLMKYLTASRGGKISDRHASVHVLDAGPPPRFIATCHKNGDLRWFRVDGIVRARIDEREPFRPCARSEVDAFHASSLDGHRGSGPAVERSFFVREPESSWVSSNILEGMKVETLHGGIRVTTKTSSVVRLARFVVSLGDAARPEDTELARVVAELARGALEQAEAVMRDTENRPSSGHLQATAGRPRSDV
jgi:predicted DNA-binding transcriptional regulator YafY